MVSKRIRQIYGIVLSVALVAAGICLMGACLWIYRSGGDQIYTAQKIATAFAPISLVVYLALALSIGGFVLHLILPQEKEKRMVEKNYALMLRKLHEKNDLSGCGDRALVAAIEAEPKRRKLHSWISLAVLGVSTVVFLCYACNGANFHTSEITQSMLRAMWVMLPCLALPFGYSVFTAYLHKKSIQRELELMKLVAVPRTPVVQEQKDHSRVYSILRVCLLVLAVVLVVVGIVGDGWMDVLTKAVNICRECVGLG